MGRCGQGGLNSGRKVSTWSIGTVGTGDHQPRNSSVVGSAQCRSSRDQDRLPLALRHHPRQQRVQRLLFLVLRRQRRIALRRQRYR